MFHLSEATVDPRLRYKGDTATTGLDRTLEDAHHTEN